MQRADQELVAVCSWTTPGASAQARAACAPRGVPPSRANLAATPDIAKNPTDKNPPSPAGQIAAEKFFPVTLGRGRGSAQKNLAGKKLQAKGARV